MTVYTRGVCTVTTSLSCVSDALVQTSYGDSAPEYYGWLYEEHGLQRCEVYVDILSHPVFPDSSPWSTWAIGADMDDATEKAAHMELTTLCS
jgi:hypothetical protein